MRKTLTQIFFLIFSLLIIIPITNYINLKLSNFEKSRKGTPSPIVISIPVEQNTINSYSIENISYVVNGENFQFKDGKSEKVITASSSIKNTLAIFGEPVYGDLNGDGIKDAALWLVNNPGGSGTFYYAVLAINNGDNTYISTNTLLLGDRIAPQTLEIHDGRAVFNYAERKANESMTTQPSVGKSLWIHYDKNTGEIGEWVKDFEGESNL